jgi:hypothetical protein
VVPRTLTWMLAIRWMAEDGAEVKAGDRVLSFDNSAVTADLETKRLALLEAQMTLRSSSDLSAMDTQTKENELAQHQVALDKAKVLATVPDDLLAKRDYQERQLEQKRAEVAWSRRTSGSFSRRSASASSWSMPRSARRTCTSSRACLGRLGACRRRSRRMAHRSPISRSRRTCLGFDSSADSSIRRGSRIPRPTTCA